MNAIRFQGLYQLGAYQVLDKATRQHPSPGLPQQGVFAPQDSYLENLEMPSLCEQPKDPYRILETEAGDLFLVNDDAHGQHLTQYYALSTPQVMALPMGQIAIPGGAKQIKDFFHGIAKQFLTGQVPTPVRTTILLNTEGHGETYEFETPNGHQFALDVPEDWAFLP